MLEQFNILAEQDSDQSIIIRLDNNRGGEITNELFEFLDKMRTVSCGVTVMANGRADSCGALILMSGTKGQRFIAPGTSVTLHAPHLIGLNVALLDDEGRLPRELFEKFRKEKENFRRIMDEQTLLDDPSLDLIFVDAKEVVLADDRVIELGIADKYSA